MGETRRQRSVRWNWKLLPSSSRAQTQRPASDRNCVRLVWRSRRTGPRWRRAPGAACRRAPPAACWPDACPHAATSGPGDVGAPEQQQQLSSSSFWKGSAQQGPTLRSVPSLQCHTMPSTRPSGRSWNQDRSCWKSTGGAFLTSKLPCGTRQCTGCFRLPTSVRTTGC